MAKKTSKQNVHHFDMIQSVRALHSCSPAALSQTIRTCLQTNSTRINTIHNVEINTRAKKNLKHFTSEKQPVV